MEATAAQQTRVLKMLESILDLPPSTLRGPEPITAFNWDSVAVMEFIARADSEFGVVLVPAGISNCERVRDLVALVAA
jgi:acyl carrier protein